MFVNCSYPRRRDVFQRYAVWLRKFVSFICILVMAFVGLSACSQTPPNNQSPIKIGFSVSLTGDFAADGNATKQGYQLWADIVNKKGGLLGRPVQLVYHDDKSDPDQAQAVYKTLITVDHVNLV